jgi:hypothetical protein
VFGCDKPWIDFDTAGLNGDVVIAGDEGGPAQLLHLQAPSRGAEFQGKALERNDAVAEAMKLGVVRSAPAGQIVRQQHRDIARGEELLQRQYLAAITQGILRQQTQLGQAVENDTPRRDVFDLLLD